MCSVCFNLDECDPCTICSDAERDRSVILVVEDPREVSAFESSGYRGLYHVLQGRISSLEGVGPEDLTVHPLLARLEREPITEICLATNPDLEGEGTAQLIAERLKDREQLVVSRIARGIPAGSSIVQVSQSILADAIEGRRRFE